MTKCGWCGDPIEPGTTGRPKKYCSTTHRQYAYHARRTTTQAPPSRSSDGWTPALQQRLSDAANLGHVPPADLNKPTVLRPVVASLAELVADALGALGGISLDDPDHELMLARYRLADSAVLTLRNTQRTLSGSGRSPTMLAQHRDDLVAVAVAFTDPTYRSAGKRRIPLVVPPMGVEPSAGVFNAWPSDRGRTEVFWRHDQWGHRDTEQWGPAGVALHTVFDGAESVFKLKYEASWTELAAVMVNAACGYEKQAVPPMLDTAAVALGRHLKAEHGQSGWSLHTNDIAQWCNANGFTRHHP